MSSPRSTPSTDYSILPRNSACLVCRRRKQRCDAAKPQCSECAKNDRSCQYEDETYRTRTQLLQDRIRELEAQINAIEGQQVTSYLSVSDPQNSSDSSRGVHSGLTSNSSHPIFLGVENSSAMPWVPNPAPGQPLTLSSFGIQPASLADPAWPPPDATKKLLDLFLVRFAQCGFDLHMGRVMQSLQPGASEPMIPALFNAMLLMACHFTQDNKSKDWENTFLQRTKTEIETNIDRAHGGRATEYNPLYHLQAMLMLGVYYYFKGRILEGHVHTSNAARFAVVLGLHQLSSRIYRRDGGGISNMVKTVLGVEDWRPRDSVELGEAINVWWSCSRWDLSGSTLNGLPPTVPFEEITTVWPCPLSDFETGNTLPDDNYSVAALFDPELSHAVADASRDSAVAISTKATILMQYAAKLDTQRLFIPQGTNQWWEMFDRCDQSLNRFTQTMPSIHTALNVEELAHLAKAQSSTYCGHVQLHCALSEYELALGALGEPRCIQPDGSLGGLSYVRCSEACRAISLVATFVEGIDMSYMNVFIGTVWACVVEVVARDVPRLKQVGRIVQAREKEEQVEMVERCMEKLAATYPVFRLQVGRLRAAKRDHLMRLGGTS